MEWLLLIAVGVFLMLVEARITQGKWPRKKNQK